MAEPPFFSSQGSEYDCHAILQEQENVEPLTSRRPRKPPTVTPKRFNKFFKPRDAPKTRSKAARQLRDITKNGANRVRLPQNNANEVQPRKRRKQYGDIPSSPPQSSPLKQVQIYEDVPASPALSIEEDSDDLPEELEAIHQPLLRLSRASQHQRLLQRSFGAFAATGRGRRMYEHCSNWRTATANFVSTPNDVHRFTGSALPFCTVSCNTNSLVAVGEEEGGIRLIDASSASDFSTPHVSFRPHSNAVMDIAFSSDDYMLASASGDQTGRIIDMHTQKAICILSGHRSSLKQIRFQPNDDNMITTSSRDGSVLVWDMRCGSKGSVSSLRTAFARNVDNGDAEPPVRYSKCSINVGSSSITAIQHMPHGQEHLLLTTNESNSSIKLWDLRNVGASRRTSNSLVSTIPAPESHTKTRNYGVNAMVLSGDGKRLYTASRDGTVYAYSTNHLVVGSTKAGLGPLYGFKHPSLRMGTFYIRASLRPAKDDRSELLALGSSDNCAVLFPTDERHRPISGQSVEASGFERSSGNMSEDRLAERRSVPGTALVRGHNKEVTALTWSHEGDLVTVGDDFMARCWREDADESRRLRQCGESGGQRWGCGWAEVESGWDELDDC